MRNVVAIAICLAGMTMFSGCNKDEGVYTIKYSPGMYSSGQNYSQSKSKGESVTLRDATYTRDGFTQTGWSTKEDGSAKDYSLNGTYSEDSDITLFPFWEADNPDTSDGYTLPTNVKIIYESEVGGTLVTTTAIKIGNNYYWKHVMPGDVDEFYLKYNNGSWAEYEKNSEPIIGMLNWTLGGTYNAEEKDNEVETFFLNFMVSAQWYTAMKNATKGGKETIAGVSTDVYTETSYGSTVVLNHDPVTNLFFKVTGTLTGAHYEVTSWDKSVTSFGITDLP